MDGSFARLVANQLPLAEAVLRMFDHISRPDFLDHVFQEYRGRSYELDMVATSVARPRILRSLPALTVGNRFL